jgi:uncharacterized membrane protein
MSPLRAVYLLVGGVFAAVAVLHLLDRVAPRRWANGAFWGLFAVSFLFGDLLGDAANGALALILALVGGVGRIGGVAAPPAAAEAEAGAAQLGGRLFLPVLLVPTVTLAGSLALKAFTSGGRPLVAPGDASVVALGVGVVAALSLAMVLIRPSPAAPLREARRVLDGVGWAAILPQLLAALGAVFALAGVGRAVGDLLGRWLPLDTPLAAVAIYGLGMTVFTLIMGNAFAAFPVMAAAIGAPLLIGRFGADPALIGAVGMLCGYCGTLMTPMAAHNIVPTALLGLPPGAVIRAQAPTALIVLAANLMLMTLLAFPSARP